MPQIFHAGAQKQRMLSHLFVCSYTEPNVLAHTPKGETGAGITHLVLDVQTGRLSKGGAHSTLPVGPNPAFLCKHPTKNIVYGTTECITQNGELLVFELDTPRDDQGEGEELEARHLLPH